VIVLLVLLAGLPARAFPAAASSPETDRQRQIEREKAALKAKIAVAEREAKSRQAQIAASESRRAALERQIAGYERDILAAQLRLDETEAALGEAKSRLLELEDSIGSVAGRAESLRGRQRDRARSVYKTGPGAYLEMLLGARSFRSFISRLGFVAAAVRQDRDRLAGLSRLSEQLERRRTEVEQQRSEIAAALIAIDDEKASIEQLKSSVASTRQRVVQETAVHRRLLAGAQADRAEYLRQMQALEAESRSIAALLRSRQRGQVFQTGSGLRLAWPTTGPVSSPFGYRIHPLFGDRRFHAGIDIEAPAGQQVIAAEAGEVVFAGSRGGYGTTVVIDHGGALATLYAHLSAVAVGTGSRVARGSRIGAVGCTGYCTGPHLHFETRVSGEPRDPMTFFRS
jgi:murein DD-endopeptidase MepM/ murein hydrolase activator NlpD